MIVEVHDLPLYDGLGNVNTFLKDYEIQIPECETLLALDQVLTVIPARWWGMHKKNIGDWKKCIILMWVRSGQIETKLTNKYDG